MYLLLKKCTERCVLSESAPGPSLGVVRDTKPPSAADVLGTPHNSASCLLENTPPGLRVEKAHVLRGIGLIPTPGAEGY